MTTNKRYINLSIFRIIAALLIIQFHIFYIIYPNEVDGAYLLSKFIQSFMTLSGFLYSQKLIEDKKTFYKKNFLKISIPALLGIIFILLWDVGYMIINQKLALEGIFIGHKALDGALLIQPGNYYYLLYVLFCYLITPFLQEKGRIRTFVVILVMGVEIIASFITRGFPVIVTCYIVGYFIGKNKFDKYVNPNNTDDVERLVKWIFIGFLAYFSTKRPLFLSTGNSYLNLHLSLMTFNLSSAVFGISIFFIIIYLLRGLNRYKSGRVFMELDGLTLFIYLLNQTFMVGATDITVLVPALMSKSILVYLFTISFAVMLYIFNRAIIQKCSLKIFKKKR